MPLDPNVLHHSQIKPCPFCRDAAEVKRLAERCVNPDAGAPTRNHALYDLEKYLRDNAFTAKDNPNA